MHHNTQKSIYCTNQVLSLCVYIYNSRRTTIYHPHTAARQLEMVRTIRTYRSTWLLG